MGPVGGLDLRGGLGLDVGLLGLGCFGGIGWRGRVVIMESVGDSGGRGREEGGFARGFHFVRERDGERV